MRATLKCVSALVCIVGFYAGVVHSDIATVTKFTVDNAMVKVGQPIVFHCWGNNVVQSTLHLSKALNATTNWTITNNEDLDSSASPSLYQVASEDSGQTDTTVKVTILSAKPSDSGTYFCWLTKHANETENITVYVMAEPTSLHLLIDGQDAANFSGPFNVTVTKTHNIQCVAYGSSPPATVALFLAGANITNMATLTSQLVTDQYGGQSYTTYLTIPNYQVLIYDLGDVLTCTAGVNSPNTFTTSEIIAPANQPPAFNCSNIAVMTAAQRAAGNLLVSCDVFGQPALIEANVMWTYKSQPYTAMGFPVNSTHMGINNKDNTLQDNSVKVVISPMSAAGVTIWTIQLTVTDPGKHEDAKTVFNFEAANSWSRVVHPVEIVGPGGSFSTAAGVCGSSFLSLVALLVAAFFASRTL